MAAILNCFKQTQQAELLKVKRTIFSRFHEQTQTQ